MSEKKSDIEQVAERLGMKPSEVTEVVVDADGVLAQTKDAKWTLIRDSGVMEFNVPGPFAPVGEAGPEEVAATGGTVKTTPAPKGRGQA